MADIEQSLCELLIEIADKNNYDNSDIKLKAFSTEGANYSSALFYAIISAPGKCDLNLFAKVAMITEKIRETMKIDKLFAAEQLFYNDLVDKWKRKENSYEVPEEHRFPFPKFYGGKSKRGEETVVLENLVKHGYGLYSRFKSVDWEYAAKSIEELSKFHALSFVFGKDHPEEYSSLCKNLELDMPFEETTNANWNSTVTKAIQVLSESDRVKVEKYLEINKDPLEDFKKYSGPKGRPVLIHGDYRPSNLMSKKVARFYGDIYKIIPVDYQTLRTGCPLSDLIYFVTLGTDEKFRAQYFHQLVDHYYQQLTLALRRFDMEITEVYPREEFDEDLKEILPYTLQIAFIVLQIVTVEADNAPELDGGLEHLNLKTSDLYAERLTGIVNDCVRWGILS